MQHASAPEHPQNIEMSLREHLLAAGASASGPSPYPPSSGPHQGHDPYHHHESDAASPHGRHLDPNVTGTPLQYGMSGDPQGDDDLSPDARSKGKRELSTSKRAAQNRAAQRAFRQRKEGYIKKLEEQVKDYQSMEANYKALQNENYQLREYILNLQSRLLESQSDFPPAPSHINLPAAGAPVTTNSGAESSSYGPEQQLRREMAAQQQQQHQHQHQPGPPPPAPVTAREDSVRHDGISQLQAAAAQSDVRPQSSPYGLGGDYAKRPGTDDAGPGGRDAKP